MVLLPQSNQDSTHETYAHLTTKHEHRQHPLQHLAIISLVSQVIVVRLVYFDQIYCLYTTNQIQLISFYLIYQPYLFLCVRGLLGQQFDLNEKFAFEAKLII